MIRKKIPSAWPYYIVGAVWLIYAVIFPLYRWWHFLLVALLSGVAFGIARYFFPGEEIEEEAPVDTGNSELDAVIRQGREAIARMRQLNEQIANEQISSQIDEMEQISTRIFEFLEKEPDKISSVRTFMNYYLPTGIDLLEQYEVMGRQGNAGTNIAETMAKIEDIMDTVVRAFRQELDNLFAGRAMDIAVEIRTLNTMMNEHGLKMNKGE